jgi:hypothetical protein
MKPRRRKPSAETPANPSRGAADTVARLAGRPLVVIGLGGIGVPVAQALVRFLTFARADTTIFLIDGDTFEERNRARVSFARGGNKALSVASELAACGDGHVAIVPVPKYVTPRNVRRLLDSGSIVMLAVDNHATRKCVSQRCARLSDVLLISGGNDAVEKDRDGTFGNVMIYERSRGRDLTPPLTRFHPEIAQHIDKRPDQLGCAALAKTTPQLLFTNLAVASTMLGVFYAWLLGRLEHDEVYLNIASARMNAVRRAVLPHSRS